MRKVKLWILLLTTAVAVSTGLAGAAAGAGDLHTTAAGRTVGISVLAQDTGWG
ncbi:hypothetical protein AB0C52_09450 [Streptomyces sp. NPDC048717]|uniref:hypothetical protein n=1 Tax=unclassified Streptomyces TaxID=2593676 RepID=UPI0034291306